MTTHKVLAIGLYMDEGTQSIYSCSSELIENSLPQDAADVLSDLSGYNESPSQILIVVNGKDGPEVQNHWNYGKDYE